MCQCKSTCFYLLKYLTKDGNDLANVLSLIKAADNHIRVHPSVADDTGSESRRSMHLLTRLLNCLGGEVEIGGQTASLALLGFPSNVYSHGFCFSFIRPAISYAKAQHQVLEPESLFANSTRHDLQDVRPTTPEGHEQLHMDGPDDGGDDAENDDGSCAINLVGDRLSVVPQHIDYANRGAAMAHLSYYEWPAIVCVTPLRAQGRRRVNNDDLHNPNEEDEATEENADGNEEIAEEIDGANDEADNAARQDVTGKRLRNKTIPFAHDHTSRVGKVQRLRTKQLVCFILNHSFGIHHIMNDII